MKNKLFIPGSPYLYTKESLTKIMWLVTASLVPAGIAGIFLFGITALWVIILAVLSAVATEGALQKLTGNKVMISDGSAFLTGLLLAYNLPPAVPFLAAGRGFLFAISTAKFAFGGLGKNIFNPALAGRVFLMAFWPRYMVIFTPPFNYDAVTSATPLTMLKEGRLIEKISYLDLFLGKRGGCIGEVCVLALVIGAAFLLLKKYISWHIPATYIVTTGLFVYVFGPKGLFTGDWLFHILSGGLILGAFFMATDYVTSPRAVKGQVVFGIGCGLFTAIIRLWSRYPEGASYAILMMNAAVPLIDRYLKPVSHQAKK